MDRRKVLMGAGGLAGAMIAAPMVARAAAAAAPQAPAVRTGPRNLITDVAGLSVGCAQDPKVRTGVTVILADRLSTAAVDVRGGGPGTRETDALEAYNLVHSANAIVLSGGSVYGLASADGVAAELGAKGIGYGSMAHNDAPVSPIVPTAILYDLANGGDKKWGTSPPYRALGAAALAAAGPSFALGTSGAGYGAMSGGLKGGLGSASCVTSDGATVGAIVAVNSMGSTVVPGSKQFWAAPFEIGDEFGGALPSTRRVGPEEWGYTKAPAARQNTTIACIATDLDLTASELKRVVMMAQDGMARAIRPIHTPFDGDVVFAIATARRPVEGMREIAVLRAGAAAADTLSRAIARGVFTASSPPGAEVMTFAALKAG
ncbi:P1 family peptidase [Novosphingobium sp. 1949]|uniref:P1 family peptidase n=1 Tax=Novosphingobium organovorum TaxID=2930092 RepID=A0ABT0BH42_9SPHN|nr:P1 family peptidase [Novosphingobium organovorum]MCJ2184245.1 P1 family peptidase [Novosphingobium organovorum]